MKRALTSTIVVLALSALPLAAEETKKDEKKTETATQPQPTVLGTEQQPVQQDSPYVRAAKLANRKGKKPTNVITNETLSKAGSNPRFTTAETQPPIVLPAPLPPVRPTPEMKAATRAAERRKAEEEAAAAKQKAADQRERELARAAEYVDEPYDDDVDPSRAEKRASDAAEAYEKEKKPPQS